MVEFALVLPLLLLLLFGIMEGSIILYDKAVITNASREAARAGIVSQNPRVTDEYIRQIVKSYGGNYLVRFGSGNEIQDSDILITPSYGDRNAAAFGTDLSIEVTYRYDFLVLPKLMSLADGINLRAVTVMKME